MSTRSPAVLKKLLIKSIWIRLYRIGWSVVAHFDHERKKVLQPVFHNSEERKFLCFDLFWKLSDEKYWRKHSSKYKDPLHLFWPQRSCIYLTPTQLKGWHLCGRLSGTSVFKRYTSIYCLYNSVLKFKLSYKTKIVG